MKKIRVFSVMALLAMGMVISISAAPQRPETEGSSDEEVLKTIAMLVRNSQYGGESSGASKRQLEILLEKHPNSVVLIPLLRTLLEGMNEKQARHNFGIAMFYLHKRGAKGAAEARLRHIVEKYPNYSRFDEVLYQLSLLEYESGRRADAIQTLEKLINGYELSPRILDARAMLKAIKAKK